MTLFLLLGGGGGAGRREGFNAPPFSSPALRMHLLERENNLNEGERA